MAIRGALLAAATISTLTTPIVFAEEETDEAKSETITITGSRLTRTDVEGPAPVTIITAEQMNANGFTTAFEALQSLTMVNGGNQGAQDAGTFTQGADSVNLRALGSGRTLTLVNGRRMSDYPLPFNGQSNIVNVANIPAIMIKQIEILPAGASAIYGSDAIAGVINIILRDDVDGMHLTARFGDTYDGGGESTRLQFVGGVQTDNLNLAYGLEVFKRDPIYANKRDYIDSNNDNPDVIAGITPAVNSRSFLILDPNDANGDGFTYVDPGAATCDPLSFLTGDSVEYSLRPGRGYYCGTSDNPGYATIRNEKENITGYLNLTYKLNSDHEMYATAIVTDSETSFDTGTHFWQGSNGGEDNGFGEEYIINTAGPDNTGLGGQIELWQRIFSPEEVNDNANHLFEDSVDFTLGARGEFFGGFDYDAALTISTYKTKRERRLIERAPADSFFLGEVTGTVTDGNGSIFNTVNAPYSNMYQALTNEQFLQISGIDTTTADSQNTTFSLVFTNEEIFEMPAGYAGLAVVLETASQDYDIQLDQKMINKEWFGFTATGGDGDRDRSAVALELRLPLMQDLTANIATRYDKYDDITAVDGAATYNIGLEYRPIDDLLIRGTYATSFRAPDMHYVNADPSGFFSSANDQYLCRRDNLGDITTSAGTANYNNCTINGQYDVNGSYIPGTGGVSGTIGYEGGRQGSPFLEEETADSLTVGFVYNLTSDWSVSVDYYETTIENGVRDIATASLITLEADCRLGTNFAGTESFDINSPRCQAAIANISRNPVSTSPFSETIDTVLTFPINAALREVAGYDLAMDYKLSTESMGDFYFELNYNITDKDESQQSLEDDVVDRRRSMQVFDLRSSATLAINWNYSDWSTTLFTRRTGSLPNWAETERCCTKTIFNASTAYQVNDDLRIGLYVNNLLDENPQDDSTFNSYPYYDTGLSNAYGREYSLQFDYSFGK